MKMRMPSRRVGMYAVIGMTAFTVEYLSFLAMLQLSFSTLLVAQSISFCCGLLVSFSGSRFFTFKHAQKSYARSVGHQTVSFIALGLTNLALSNVLLWLFAEQLSIAPFIAKLMVMALIVSWNYLILDKVIFKLSRQ